MIYIVKQYIIMGLFSRNKKQDSDKYYIKNPEEKRTLTNEELFGISLSLIINGSM